MMDVSSALCNDKYESHINNGIVCVDDNKTSTFEDHDFPLYTRGLIFALLFVLQLLFYTCNDFLIKQMH